MAPEPTSIPALRMDSLLADTLRAEDISGDAIELAEAGLDQSLTDGMIRDVPVIGSIIAALKAGRAVRHYLFLRKLLAFLGPLKDVGPQERGRMITRLESDPAFGERVGERLLMLLERLDSLTKPCMLGRAFHAYLTEKIDASTLQRLSYAIDRVMPVDLPFLRAFLTDPDGARLSECTRQDFVNAGLAHVPPCPPLLIQTALCRLCL